MVRYRFGSHFRSVLSFCIWLLLDRIGVAGEVAPTLLSAEDAEDAIDEVPGDHHVSLLQKRIRLEAIKVGRGSREFEKGNEQVRASEAAAAAATAAQYRYPILLLAMGALAASFGFLRQPADVAGAKPRAGHWDAAKFWCMTAVVYVHVLGLGWPFAGSMPMPVSTNLNPVAGFEVIPVSFLHLVQHVGVPGFSFISGIFAASEVEHDLASGTMVMSVRRLQANVRDLVLYNLTLLPLDWFLTGVFALVASSNLSDFTKPWAGVSAIPILTTVPHNWYLGSLFLWKLITPLICRMKWPVATSFLISVLCRSRAGDSRDVAVNPARGPSFTFLPLFVLGFVLAGGGLDPEGRASRLRELEAWLVRRRARVAAGLLAIGYTIMALFHYEFFSPLDFIICSQETFNYDLSMPWSQGGLLTDLLRKGFGALFVLVFLVLVFAMPNSPTLSAAGSRTLYIYLLHQTFVGPFTMTVPLFKPCGNWGSFLIFLIFGIYIVLLTGSKLTETLAKPFIQPDWLVRLLFHETKAPASDAGGSAARPLTGEDTKPSTK